MMGIRFKDRALEWWLATCTFGFGLFIAAPGHSMDGDAFLLLILWMKEFTWGLFFIMTGSLHLTALTINGRAWWTPFLRAGMTAANFTVYFIFGYGFWLLDHNSTAVWSYGVMISSAAAICFYRASSDAAIAWRLRRDP